MSEFNELLSKPVKNIGKRNVLVAGETGAGKTSFLNLIFNRKKIITVDRNTKAEWFFGGDFESEEKKVRASFTDSVSSHQDPIDPNLYWFDSPDLGDTRAMEYDLKHALGELQLINCLFLIINGEKDKLYHRSVCLLSHLQQYIPKSFLPNLFLVLTHTDHETSGTFIDMLKSHRLLLFPKSNIIALENPIGDLLKKAFGEYSMKKQRRIQEDMEETRKELNKMFEFINGKVSMEAEAFVNLEVSKDLLHQLFDANNLKCSHQETLLKRRIISKRDRFIQIVKEFVYLVVLGVGIYLIMSANAEHDHLSMPTNAEHDQSMYTG